MQPSLEASPRFPGHRAVSGEHSQGLRGQRGGPLADCSDYGGGAANGPMERYKVVGMIAFLWHGPSSPTNSGTEGMAQTVRNAHQEIIDAINYNNP